MTAIKKTANVTAEMVKDALKGNDVSKLTFSKLQIIKSQRYADRCDALNALLVDDEKYSFSEVDKILQQFDEGGNK